MKEDKGFLRVVRMIPEQAKIDLSELPAGALERIKADEDAVFDDDIWGLLKPRFNLHSSDIEINFIDIKTPEGKSITLWDADEGRKEAPAPLALSREQWAEIYGCLYSCAAGIDSMGDKLTLSILALIGPDGSAAAGRGVKPCQ